MVTDLRWPCGSAVVRTQIESPPGFDRREISICELRRGGPAPTNIGQAAIVQTGFARQWGSIAQIAATQPRARIASNGSTRHLWQLVPIRLPRIVFEVWGLSTMLGRMSAARDDTHRYRTSGSRRRIGVVPVGLNRCLATDPPGGRHLCRLVNGSCMNSLPAFWRLACNVLGCLGCR